jgi:hypothetical protein
LIFASVWPPHAHRKASDAKRSPATQVPPIEDPKAKADQEKKRKREKAAEFVFEGVDFLMKKDALKKKVADIIILAQSQSAPTGLQHSLTLAAEKVVSKGGALDDLPYAHEGLGSSVLEFLAEATALQFKIVDIAKVSVAETETNVEAIKIKYDTLKIKVMEHLPP